MKELFTLVMSLFCLSVFSQTALFEGCLAGVQENAGMFSRQPELVSGKNLTAGAVYRYNDFVESPFKMYALVKIDTISNAHLLVLDQSTTNATSNDHWFQPRIAPDLETLSANRVGFVQFTLTFYNADSDVRVLLPEISLTNFDLDGHLTGSNGSFRETLWTVNENGVTYSQAPQTEIVGVGNVNEGSAKWKKYLGATAEYDDGSFLPETALNSRFLSASSVSFRMGYDFKYGGVSYTAPSYRQYASKLSCLNFLAAGPLPLDLTNFTAAYRDQHTQLTWTTENETRHNHFEIERSFNKQDFRTIAFVLGPRSVKGASNLYEYTDKTNDLLGNEDIYYRLKQVDTDGGSTYSKTRQIHINRGSPLPVISPNPFQDKLEVRYNSTTAAEVGILIRNISGQVTGSKQQLINKGINRISIQGLAGLPAGLYIIQVLVNNSLILHQKLVKN